MSGGAAVVGVMRARSSRHLNNFRPAGYRLLSRGDATEAEESEDEDCDGVEGLQQLEDRLDKLRLHEDEVKADVRRVLNRLMETQKYWGSKQEALENKFEAVSEEIAEVEEKLRRLKHPEMYPQEEIPPGPTCFSFVRSQAFLLASACIIVANIYTMVLELTHPSYKGHTFFLDQLFLIFYVAEFGFKAMYYRNLLLCGKISESCWNWLDLVIVITGVLDQWVEPLLLDFGILPASVMQTTWAVGFIRLLRLARLPRILKIVQVFLKSDFSWVSSDRFQVFMMGVIGFNCIVMSFEADYPQFALWPYLENILMAIFLFELLVRLRLAGCSFFCARGEMMWNWMDFIIVIGGVVDIWLLPCISLVQTLLGMEPTQKSHVGQVLIMLRMARLLRILRLVRLIKNIPPLFTLLVGIVQAMYGMIWVLVLTCVLLYTAALVCVKLIGQGLVTTVPEDVAVVFPSVPQSMFVLFMAMNGNAELLTPVFRYVPVSKFVFVVYMVVLSWGILSILTAVVSENMINATVAHREEQEALEQERLRNNSQDWLSEIFDKTDTDGTGLIEREEFDDMLKDDFIVDELCSASGGLRKADLVAVFDCLSSVQDDNLIIRRRDFVQGLMTHSQSPSVSQRDILRLEKRMLMQERFLLQMMERVDAVATKPRSSMSSDGHEEGRQSPTRPMLKQRRTEAIMSLADAETASQTPKVSATKAARERHAFEATVAVVSKDEFDHRTSSVSPRDPNMSPLLARGRDEDWGSRSGALSSGAATRNPNASPLSVRGRDEDRGAHSGAVSSGVATPAPKGRPRPGLIRTDSGDMAAPSAPGSFATGSAVAPPQPQVAQAAQQGGDMLQDIRWVAGQVQALNAKFLSFQRNQDEALLMMRKVQGYLLIRDTNERVEEKARELCANRRSAVLAGGCGRSARTVTLRRRPPMPVAPPEPESVYWDAAAAHRPAAFFFDR